MDDTADQLMADPALRALVMPGLRADLEALETYRHVPRPPTRVPITAIAGAGDRSPTPGEMREWARHTASAFRLATVPGGHFFLRESRAAVLDVIAGALRPTVAA
jgi:surfactin synthase thioesterase subunit